ncbi:MAG: RloB domain-containing protein, partial [Deltaproteobacteria bacterium]|nr:RloB domain-containing protein [Deltaproteobacteria bacterium]
LSMAKREGIRIAYSNEAFELWYILHFDYMDAGVSRGQYSSMLAARLGEPYRKNSEDIYEKILPLQGKAIRNATRLLASHDPLVPEHCNPSTTVHLLVQCLNGNPAADEDDILDNLI